MFQEEYAKLQQENFKLKVEQEILRAKLNQLRSQLKKDAVEEYWRNFSIAGNEVCAQAFIEGFVESHFSVINMVFEDIDLVQKSSIIVLKLMEIESKNGKLNG